MHIVIFKFKGSSSVVCRVTMWFLPGSPVSDRLNEAEWGFFFFYLRQKICHHRQPWQQASWVGGGCLPPLCAWKLVDVCVCVLTTHCNDKWAVYQPCIHHHPGNHWSHFKAKKKSLDEVKMKDRHANMYVLLYVNSRASRFAAHAVNARESLFMLTPFENFKASREMCHSVYNLLGLIHRKCSYC